MAETDPLELEGEVAADFLEEFLDVADLDGDLDIELSGGRVYISVNSEGENNLTSVSDPEVVAALQEIVRLAVQNKTGENSRLILDIGGSREARANQLREIAKRAMDKAAESGAPQHLKPMSSYERKLVHDYVAESGFHSESEGEGRTRHIVVSQVAE